MKNIKILISPIVYLMSFNLIEFFISIIIKIILMFDIKFSYIYIHKHSHCRPSKKNLKNKKKFWSMPLIIGHDSLFIDDVLRTSLRTEKDEIPVGAQLDPIGEKVKVHNKLSMPTKVRGQ